MHPLLFHLGPIPIHTYGFMIALGFFAAVATIKRLALRSGFDVDKTLDLTFWTLLVGFAGSRLLYVLTRFDSYLSAPLDIFKIWEGGLVFFGGPLVAVPFLVWKLRKWNWGFWKLADVFTPGLVVAHAFGRFGCLAAGCCYGRPTGTDFGIKLHSELVEPALRGIPLHPTQLYEASALLILYAGLLLVFKSKKFHGQVVLTYFLTYPIIRSVIEIFRGDLIRGFVIDGVLSTSQFISILIFIVASIALYWRLNQLKTSDISKK